MSDTIIKVDNIRKRYGPVISLGGLSLEVKEGELFGLIGPDGAGKTTLIRILTTLLLPDSGHAEVLGLDVVRDYKKLRKLFGYMPGRFSLYEDLTVEENLQLFASIFGTSIEENYDLIKDIYQQIKPFKTRRAGKLSGGMKQKLALSCAMIHKPDVIFLDEPTTGVDAVSRKEFWKMLKKLQERGVSMLVSTPYMDEAVLCDRVALIQGGNIMKIDTPQHIIEDFSKPLYAVYAENKYQVLKDIRDFQHTNSAFIFGESIHYTDRRIDFDTDDLSRYLEIEGHRKLVIKSIKASIEDCFMELMGRKKESQTA